MFRGFYINLPANKERRDALARQLANVHATERYRCFEAVDGKAVGSQFATKLKPGELGIWLSVLRLLEQNLNSDQHLHVVEDDIVFARDAVPLFDSYLGAIDARSPDWDILFTELFVPPPDAVMYRDLATKMRAYRKLGQRSLVALGRWSFAGFTSYFINKRPIAKILSRLERGWESGLPIDLQVRNLIWQKQLNAFVNVPFLTSISVHNEQSDIRGSLDLTRRALDHLRRAFFVDADPRELLQQISDFNRTTETDDLAKIYLQTLTYVLSSDSVIF